MGLSSAQKPSFGAQKPSAGLVPMGITAESMEGYKVTQYYGMVRGIVIFSVVSKSLLERLMHTLSGKEGAYAKACEQARNDAYQQMIMQSLKLGANTVLAVSYDAMQVGQNIQEIVCYGTAVSVEKIV